MAEQPEKSERVQLVVSLLPETKERLKNLPTSMSMTKILEKAAASWEALTLDRLKSDEHRQLYLQGELDCFAAFGRNNFKRNKFAPMSQRTAVLGTRINAESKAQLQRYSKFYGIPLAYVIDKLSRHFKGPRPPDPEPDPAQEINPEQEQQAAHVLGQLAEVS